MLDSSKAAVGAAGCLLALLLAGCVTDRSRDAAGPPNWPEEAPAPVPAAPPVEVAEPAVVAPSPAPVPAPAAPPVVAPVVPTNRVVETWVPLARWCKANNLGGLCPLTVDSMPGYTLSTTGGTFLLHIGSPLARWDGLDLRLAYAPQVWGGQPYVHAFDLRKTIEPLLLGNFMTLAKTNPTIVIDAGHGGDDSGTRSVLSGGYERTYTLDWAKRLEGLLATNGWQVFLTRTDDTHVSLSDRVSIADAHRADLFVSLHFNSAGTDSRQAGLETYYVTPSGMVSSVTRGFSDDPALVFPNNGFDAENVQLAFGVHRTLVRSNGNHDRGVRRARYLTVLRGQNRPAILIEGGYLSNPQEARRIADPAYRQKLAEGVAKAIAGKGVGRANAPSLPGVSATATLRMSNDQFPMTKEGRMTNSEIVR